MGTALLDVKAIEVRRGMGVVLSDHDLTVEEGQLVALTGKNGAGKSTLLEAAAGLLALEKGEVRHGGEVVVDHEGRRARSKLSFGLTLQKNGMLGSEIVNEHLIMAASMKGSAVHAAPFLDAFQLAHRANDQVAHLSQGQARKVAVLAGILPAFASKTPGLVLLDEPAAGLDDDAVETLCEWLVALRMQGHGLMICSHDPRILATATHVHDVNLGTTVEQSTSSSAGKVIVEATKSTRFTPRRFGQQIHFRTLLWLNQNAMAALLTLGILLALGDFMTALDPMQRLGVLFAPALAAGLCGEPLVAAAREERTAAWWRAVAGGAPHAGWLPLVLGGAITLISTICLQQPIEMLEILVGAALCAGSWHAIGWAQRSTNRLARPQAVFIGLLTPVLILPYALIIDWLTR